MMSRKVNCTSQHLYPMLRPLDQVVDVDYYMPGCPPESHQIAAVIDLVIKVMHGEAELPPKGAVIGAGNSTVCDECPRARNVKMIKAFKRIQDIAPSTRLSAFSNRASRATVLPHAAAAMRAVHRRARSALAVTVLPKV